MKIIKELLKKLIVYIVLFMIIMSSIAPPMVLATDEAKDYGYKETDGDFLVEQVKEYYNNLLDEKKVVIDNSVRTPYWSEGLEGEGQWHVNSSAGVIWAYDNFLNCNLTSYGFSYNLQNIYDKYADKDFEKYFTNIGNNPKAGDIIIGKNNDVYYAEIYLGSWEEINFGNESNMLHQQGTCKLPFSEKIYLRPTSEVSVKQQSYSSSGSKRNTKKEAKKSVNVGTSKFFFNGIPDGKYSLATKDGLFSTLINKFGELLDFFAGLMTYLLRGVIISIISLFDRLLNNTVKSINNSPQSLQETGVSPTSADDPKSINRPVTIEGLVFDNIDIFDINIFNISESETKDEN